MYRLLSLFFLALFVVLLTPLVALAQEADGGGGFNLISLLTEGNAAAYVLIVLALVELAKRVVAVIPGKPASAQLGAVEGVIRNLLDFLAGKTGNPSDPSLIKRE